jgi:hypothetical protein
MVATETAARIEPDCRLEPARGTLMAGRKRRRARGRMTTGGQERTEPARRSQAALKLGMGMTGRASPALQFRRRRRINPRAG